MESQSNLEALLKQLEDVLNFVDSQAGKVINSENITPDIIARMDKLEKQLELFTSLGEKVVELAEIAKEKIQLGMQELESLEELKRIAEKVMGVADPDSTNYIEKRKTVEKQVETMMGPIPPRFNTNVTKATAMKNRAESLLKSYDPKTTYEAIQEDNEEFDAENSEIKVTDKSFVKRRRRRLKNFGGDKV